MTREEYKQILFNTDKEEMIYKGLQKIDLEKYKKELKSMIEEIHKRNQPLKPIEPDPFFSGQVVNSQTSRPNRRMIYQYMNTFFHHRGGMGHF